MRRQIRFEPDDWVTAAIRETLERRYYARINAQSHLELLWQTAAFRQLQRHVGFFSDHGIVHMRDVARQLLQVLANVHGLLIPLRSPARFQRMQALGVLLAYLHDIGMVDFSDFGRTMHPEYACQAVFGPALADWLTAVWQDDCGGLSSHLARLAE
ncbi:MAG: hypothetical protein R3264_23055, partial [Anaerolineae bacterium]|nr:hypothetical protein [Anaerolineae bacterium]